MTDHRALVSNNVLRFGLFCEVNLPVGNGTSFQARPVLYQSSNSVNFILFARYTPEACYIFARHYRDGLHRDASFRYSLSIERENNKLTYAGTTTALISTASELDRGEVLFVPHNIIINTYSKDKNSFILRFQLLE
jgi:hypothetical protein